MSLNLQQYVRQVKPRNESYTPPVDKIQNFLTEGVGASTYFEGVIAACHNMSGKSEKIFKKDILKDKTVELFLTAADSGGKPNFATHGKTKVEKLEILYQFAKVCKKTLKGTSNAGAGQKKLKVSRPWEETAKKSKDTSKADILVNNKKTSVKGPTAQLMSGEKKETKATVLAALAISGGDKELEENLITEVNKFVTSTRTIGAEVNSGLLKKMSPAEAKTTGNEEAKKIVDNQEKMKKDITATFMSAFEDEKIANAFARESMTGWEKFGGKAFPSESAGDTEGEATHMLIWDYRMDRMKFLKIDDSFISTTAQKMNVRPDLKSNSYSKKVDGKDQKLGYSFYQTLRMGVKVVLDKQGDIVKEVEEQIEHNQNLLTEGVIDEGKFKDLVGKVWNWFKEKMKKVWNWLVEFVTKLRDDAVEIIKNGAKYALNAFELDVTVKVNTEVKLL